MYKQSILSYWILLFVGIFHKPQSIMILSRSPVVDEDILQPQYGPNPVAPSFKLAFIVVAHIF